MVQVRFVQHDGMAGIAADRTENFVATKSGASRGIWIGRTNFVAT
jgi:hypothetical protein